MENQNQIEDPATSSCTSCQRTKANLRCVSCDGALCKHCAQFIDHTTFSFLPEMPGGIVPGSYCVNCYDTKVRPEVDAYESIMDKARNISVYMKNQGKEVRMLKRAQFPVTVENCEDHAETLMRLAFKTVLLEDYDTLIHVQIVSKKLRDGSYQKGVWNGFGTPAVRRARRPATK